MNRHMLVALICSATVLCANAQQNTTLGLTALPKIPDPPRSSAGCAFTGGTIVYIAGHTNTFHEYPPENFTDKAHQLNTITLDQWDVFPSYPIKVQGFEVVAYEDHLYGFGGFVHHGQGDWPVGSITDVYRYDPVGKWKKIDASLPAPRSSYACSVVGSKAYIFGGWNGKAKPPAAGAPPGTPWPSGGDFYTDIWVFDLKSEKFEQQVIPFSGKKRRALASATYGDKIVFVGGLGEGGFEGADLLDEVVLFDTKSLTFQTLPPLPKPLFSPSAAVRGDILYVGGGLYANATFTEIDEIDAIQTLDLSKGANATWGTLPVKLRTARSFVKAVNIPKVGVGFFGGHGDEFPVTDADLLEEYPADQKIGPLSQSLAMKQKSKPEDFYAPQRPGARIGDIIRKLVNKP